MTLTAGGHPFHVPTQEEEILHAQLTASVNDDDDEHHNDAGHHRSVGWQRRMRFGRLIAFHNAMLWSRVSIVKKKTTTRHQETNNKRRHRRQLVRFNLKRSQYIENPHALTEDDIQRLWYSAEEVENQQLEYLAQLET